MKRHWLPWLLLTFAALLAPGCGHLDLAPSNDPNRVLKGTIAAGTDLPAGAEIFVRLIATSAAAARPAAGDSMLTQRSAPPAATSELVLGESRQVLTATSAAPVPFQIEYRADDATLRHGLNVEARISVGGKLRFRTVNAHVVTLASSPFRQDVVVQPVQ